MKFVLFAMIVVAYLATGDAIKCYSCTYPPTEKCGAAFDPDGEGVLSEECDELATRCVKFIEGPNITRICQEGSPNSAMGECETDFCNGADSIDAALSTLMVLASALILGS